MADNNIFIVGPHKPGVEDPVVSSEQLKMFREKYTPYVICPCCGQRIVFFPLESQFANLALHAEMKRGDINKWAEEATQE